MSFNTHLLAWIPNRVVLHCKFIFRTITRSVQGWLVQCQF